MANEIQIRPLLEAGREAMLAAWPDVASISFGRPRTAVPTPNGIITWKEVDVSMDGKTASLVMTDQTYSLLFIGRFPFPADPTQQIALLASDRANLLIAQLQTSAMFAGIGYFPLVTKVSFSDDIKPEGDAYWYVTIEFSCNCQARHH